MINYFTKSWKKPQIYQFFRNFSLENWPDTNSIMVIWLFIILVSHPLGKYICIQDSDWFLNIIYKLQRFIWKKKPKSYDIHDIKIIISNKKRLDFNLNKMINILNIEIDDWNIIREKLLWACWEVTFNGFCYKLHKKSRRKTPSDHFFTQETVKYTNLKSFQYQRT